MSSHLLNIASLQPVTESLGPGKRFALWVQGCPFNCRNCVSPDWIPFKRATVASIRKVAKMIIDTVEIEGISISGGEPMMQAGRLAQLLEIVKKERPELNVIVFSGFRLEQLIWEEARMLLGYTDVLIDGLYIEKLNDDKGLRGSSNQQVHFLTERLMKYKDTFLEKGRSLEFHIKNDGVLMVGVPAKNFKW